MADRRYNDTEIAAIFSAATEGPQGRQPDVPREEGLTLADLQAIGREVGIPSDAVARAALPWMSVEAVDRGRSSAFQSAWRAR